MSSFEIASMPSTKISPSIISQLKAIEAITEVRTVYGEFDVIARVDHDDMRTLDTVVTKLRTIEGVLRSVTLISA